MCTRTLLHTVGVGPACGRGEVGVGMCSRRRSAANSSRLARKARPRRGCAPCYRGPGALQRGASRRGQTGSKQIFGAALSGPQSSSCPGPCCTSECPCAHRYVPLAPSVPSLRVSSTQSLVRTLAKELLRRAGSTVCSHDAAGHGMRRSYWQQAKQPYLATMLPQLARRVMKHGKRQRNAPPFRSFARLRHYSCALRRARSRS